MPNAIVKIGKMASTSVDHLLRSVQIAADLENGAHVVLGAEVSGQNGVYAGAAATDVTTQEVLIIEAPVLVETGGYRIGDEDPGKFINKSGKVVRARHVRKGDEITISIDGFSAAPTVGQFAIPANGATKLAPSAVIGTTLISYQVLKRDDIAVGTGFVQAYKLRVVKSA
jgi:hypothetical protein